MKNILLFSTILAAGTLAVNAATTIDALVHLSFESASGGASTANDGTRTEATVSNSGGYLNYYSAAQGAVGDKAYHNNSNYLEISNTGLSWQSDWSLAFTFAIGTQDSFDDWAYLVGVSSGSDSSLKYYDIQTKGNSSAGLGVWGSFGSGSNSGTTTLSTDPLKVVFVYDYDEIAKTSDFSLYVGGTKVSSKTGVNVSELTDSNNLSFRLGWGFGGNSRQQGLYDEFALYNAALTSEQVAYYLSDGTKVSPLSIPEPSMFGLLAGLGGLALAGTRRRRR